MAQQEYFHAPEPLIPLPKAKPKTAPAKKQTGTAVKYSGSAEQKPRPASKKPKAPQNAPVKKPVAKSSASTATAGKPKKRRERSKILFVVLLFWVILAISVFNSYFSIFSDDDRYLEAGEEFIRAQIMQDEESLSGYIHTYMRGNLYPMSYQSADSCTVQGSVLEEADAEALTLELSEQYGLKDTVLTARWILVEYTVEENGRTEACTIEVLVANIGGDIYAVKTRNMTGHAVVPETT